MIQNTSIVDFNSYFKTSISTLILDTLHSYKLFTDNTLTLRNRFVKNFIINLTLLQISILLDIKSINKNILIIQPDIIDINSEILTYFENPNVLKLLLLKILKDIKKKYPDRVLIFKEYKDITNPDTIAFVFNKCNNYVAGNGRNITRLKLAIGSKNNG